MVRTALSEVGKTYPYNLLRFNCENFAIFCKISRSNPFLEIRADCRRRERVATHPILGMVAELNTRFVEWLAFHFGGPAGKQLSLEIRRIGAAVTRWLVSQGGRNRAEHRAGNRGL